LELEAAGIVAPVLTDELIEQTARSLSSRDLDLERSRYDRMPIPALHAKAATG
jgi:hypothetical protein